TRHIAVALAHRHLAHRAENLICRGHLVLLRGAGQQRQTTTGPEAEQEFLEGMQNWEIIQK
ncbi:MAG: hypothetical protein MJY79_08630, partial [Bacteroidaceae bacterium]|nr:hypothetical protein [Bacteroidaceae bacterium]